MTLPSPPALAGRPAVTPALPARTTPVLTYVLKVAAVAAIYYGAARLGLLLQLPGTNASPVWPPSGIGLAAVLLLGLRVWPGIALGAFLANRLTLPATPAGFVAASAIGVGNTLEQVAAWLLIRRLVPAPNPFERARDVFWFVVAAGASCALASTNGATSLWLTGIIPGAVYGPVWFTWWLGDTAGMLVLTPLLVTLLAQSDVRWRPKRPVEAVLFLVVLLATGQVVFGGWVRVGAAHHSLGFTLIPFLVWAAFRFGQTGVLISTVLVSGGAIWGTIHGFGPFVRDALNESMLLLQAFIGISTVTALVLAAVLTERRAAEVALHQAHEELQGRAAQLEAANKELEAFSYSVSHDLRAPLRSIDGFSQVLIEDCGERLDEEGRQALQRVRAAAQHMAQLIDDLLTLSRITRGELRREAVDLSALARTQVAELQRRCPERSVEFVVADGLTVDGDPRLLRVALDNLLANAWKFSAKKAQARIEVGVVREDRGPVIFVRDNGAGFDMAYAGKLFGAFQRLHTVHEFPGTGIGLATVQRIVHRHGGRVWAEGAVENGATFYFTLEPPRNDQRPAGPLTKGELT